MMSKTQIYILLALLAVITGGGASYLIFAKPQNDDSAAARARAEKFFSADPKDYPTTGGEKMKVQF